MRTELLTSESQSYCTSSKINRITTAVAYRCWLKQTDCIDPEGKYSKFWDENPQAKEIGDVPLRNARYLQAATIAQKLNFGN